MSDSKPLLKCKNKDLPQKQPHGKIPPLVLQPPVNPTPLGWKDQNHGDVVLDKPPDNEVILRRSIFTCPIESDQFIELQWTPQADKHNPDSKNDDLYSQRHNPLMKSSTKWISCLLVIRVKALFEGHRTAQTLGTQDTYNVKGLQKIKVVILSRIIWGFQRA